MIGIYKITNMVNGKAYIGQSVNIEKRFINHKSTAFNSNSDHYDYPLYRAIRKYGIENFSFDVIEECSVSELNEKEIWYISQYHTYGSNGYNQDTGGNQASHYNKLSEELVDQIIAKLKTSTDNSDDIGEEFGVSGRTIRNINTGSYCRRDNENYPIRPPLWTPMQKTYSCKICGATIVTANSLCIECAHKSQRRTDRPEPLELAKMVKEYGFIGAGKVLGVSDNAVKKWCKSYDIPYIKDDLILWYNTQIGITD